jgi:protein-disulfide isomerase/uncharacterized membrane protein
MHVNRRLALVLGLALVGAGLAASLLLQHHGEALGTAAVSQLCGAGAESGCDQVNRSPFAEIAGVPWAGIGLLFYLSMLALALLGVLSGEDVKPIAAAAAFALFAIALAIDVVLFGVQAFRIHAFCKLCLATYVLNAAAVVLLWPLRRAGEGAPARLREPQGRLLIASWVIAAVAFGMGLWGVETALDQREEERGASILGKRPASAPIAPKGNQTPLEAAQAEAARLQGILDDPQKFEAYQAEKSLRDFAAGPEVAIDLKTTAFKGPANAPIKVVEYSDFRCPFCKQIAQAFGAFVGKPSADRVAIYYKFYPLDSACNPAFPDGLHPGACWLAYGGVCAQEQGKFWAYHDKVFADQAKVPDKASVVKMAGEIGMNESSFASCIDQARTKDHVAADIAEGTRNGVKGTPTIFIDNRRLPRTNEFLGAVEQESKRLGLGPMPPMQ